MGWIEKPEITGLKVLILGDYGTGKSYFARSFPEPIFLLDFDGGSVGYLGRKVFVPDYFRQQIQPSQLFALIEQDLDLLINS